MTLTVGRPVQVHYAEDECHFSAKIPVSLKRALADNAEQHGRLLREEIALAFQAWIDGAERSGMTER